MSALGGEQGPSTLELEVDQLRLALEQARALGFEVTKARDYHQEQAEAWKATAEKHAEALKGFRVGELQRRSDDNAHQVEQLSGLLDLAWAERDASRLDQLVTEAQLEAVRAELAEADADWEELKGERDQAVLDALALRKQLDGAEAGEERALASRVLTVADAEVKRVKAVLARLLEGLSADRPRMDNGQAPGHSHDIPGIWDRDNGAKAGKVCELCAAWMAARAEATR